jgi:hypothetical protein
VLLSSEPEYLNCEYSISFLIMSPSQDIRRFLEDQRGNREGANAPSQNTRISRETASQRGNVEANAAGKRKQVSAETSPGSKRPRVQVNSRQSRNVIVISDDSDEDGKPGESKSLQTQAKNVSMRGKPRGVSGMVRKPAPVVAHPRQLLPDGMGRNQSFGKPQSRQGTSTATRQITELSDDSDQETAVKKDEVHRSAHSAKSGKFSMPRAYDKDGKKDLSKSHGSQKSSSLARPRPSRPIVLDLEDSDDDEAGLNQRNLSKSHGSQKPSSLSRSRRSRPIVLDSENSDDDEAGSNQKNVSKSHGSQKPSSLSRYRPGRRIVLDSENSDDEAGLIKQVSTHENSNTDQRKRGKAPQSTLNDGTATKDKPKARKPHRSNFEINNPEQFKRDKQLQASLRKGNTIANVPKVHPPLQDLGFNPVPKSKLSKWMSFRDDLLRNLKKYVTPTPIGRPVTYLQDLFDTPVMDNRSFVCESIKPRQKPGRGAPKPLIPKGSFQIASFVNQSKKEESFDIELWDECSPNGSDDELRQVGDTICLLLDRMPVQIQDWVLPKKKLWTERFFFLEGYHKSAIVYTASRKLFPGYVCPIPMEFPISVQMGDTCLATDDRERVFKLWAKEIPEDFPIPPYPKFLLFNDCRKKVTAENAKVYDRGFAMLKSAMWQLFGAVGTVDALKRKFAEVTTLIGVERTWYFPGPYGGRPLWNRPTVDTEHRAQFDMASIARRDTTLSSGQEIFSNPGLSRTKAVLVFGAILQSWEQGSGLLNAWQAGMVVAHGFRKGKIPSVSFCDGTGSDGGHGHVCSGCYHVWNCLEFADASGARSHERICPRCISKTLGGRPVYDDAARQVDELDALIKSQLAAKKEVRPSIKKIELPSIKISMGKEKVLPLTMNPDPPSPEAMLPVLPLSHLLTRLRALSAGEFRQFPALVAIQSTDHQIREFLGEHVDNMEWKDAYAPSVSRVCTVKSFPGRDPFQPSPDATFPYATKEGRTALHLLSNLSITTMYLNFMKQQWLPGIIGLVSESQALRDLGRKNPVWINHMRRFDHQYGLTKQTAWARSGRLNKAVSFQRYESQKAEWVSGRCHMKSIDLFQHEYSSHTNWRPAGHDRIEMVIAQMERHFGRTVPRSQYGAPWIFIEEHLPEDWNWKWLWHTFKVRRVRMSIWCNKHWVTVDDIECLLLECIFQWLKNDGKDTFLGLETTLFARHPLCFVIAKKHHGRQMQTGWKCFEPTDFFEDYDESLSNLSIETQLSNYCKHNFDEGYYGAILADLKAIPYNSDVYTRLPDPVPPIRIRCLPEKDYRAIAQARNESGEGLDSEEEDDDISDVEEAED